MNEFCSKNDPANSDAIDPGRLAVFRALVEAILDEMGEALRHGAFSQNIKERRDYSCALFNSEGDLVAGAAHIPVHLGSMDTVCRASIAKISMNHGDAIIVNDPYSGGTHLPDITIIVPVFLVQNQNQFDRPEFYLGVRAHHADVGGIAPGSLPLSTRLDEEGLIIPPTLIVKDGKILDSVINELASHSRQPSERSGDLRAQLAAAAVGSKRIKELADTRGIENILVESDGLIAHSARLLTEYLSRCDEGTGTADCIMDSIPGEPGAKISCKVTLTKNPEPKIEFDFTESSDVHPGCLNAVPAIVNSAVIYSLRLFLPEDTPVTCGLLKPVAIKLRKGSVLDPEPGAAVAGGNVETSQAIVECVLDALAGLGWDSPASSQGTMNNVLMGSIDTGDGSFSFYETIGGGAGAFTNYHGESGIQTHMTNTRNTPIEALEREFPIRVKSYSLRGGSGGDGKWRGGDGIIREFEILVPTRLTILSHHRNEGPSGRSGGGPGKPGRNILIRDGVETELPSRVMVYLMEGDVIRIETPGGGGYGG